MKSGTCLILGRPNVGKSTLLNALLSRKVAIVTARPQTTREAIRGLYQDKSLQIVFTDTPGLFKGTGLLDQFLDRTARKAISGADVILYLIDAQATDYGPDEGTLKSLKTSAPIILVFNKIDLATAPMMEALISHFATLFPKYPQIQASALTGFGLKEIKEKIASFLPESEPLYPAGTSPEPDKAFLAKEAIREKLLRFLEQEVPHQSAVVIDSLEEDKGAYKIHATIVVAKESQKPIVIGKGGSMIKRISMAARHELERQWGTHVTLVAEVVCIPGWREDPEKLRKLGYGPQGDR